MIWAINILAEHDAGLIRVIVVVIFLIIWGVKAATSLGKAQKKPPGAISPPPLPPARPRVPLVRPMPPVALRRIPPQARIVSSGAMTRSPLAGAPLPPLSALMKSPAKAAAKPRAIRNKKPAPPPLPQSAQVASIVSALASPARPPVSTSEQVRLEVASWINLGTLRSQFLLAEALRPPVALREDL